MLADYVNALRIKNKMTIEEVARLSDNPEPTVKNILTKKTLNPGFEVGCSLIYAVGGSVDEFFGHVQSDANDQKSMLYLKEFYEKQMSEQNTVHENHIKDVKEHYELRISEWKERFVEMKERHKEQLDEVNEHLATTTLDKRWFRISCVVSVFALVGFCILEILTPGMGWLRY